MGDFREHFLFYLQNFSFQMLDLKIKISGNTLFYDPQTTG